jgi:flagellar assembly protein FliH
MAATKFKFENSFDNGAQEVASAADRAQQQAVQDAKADGDSIGYARGYEQAMSEIAAQTQSVAERLCTEMLVLFETIDGVKRQLVADGAHVAVAAGSAIAGQLIEKLAEAHIANLVEGLIADVIDMPRLVLRVAPALLDSTRSMIESVSQAHGFSGRLIFLGEPDYANGDITIEWAHGGLTFSAAEQQTKIQNSAQAFVDSMLGGGEMIDNAKVQAS